ncbi:MAG TPA: metal-dependent hydrolase [Candidatus Nanoarchaeia archaeon]|nr:metal-dependent hydrolase [Candidatus Nanoarchaeia archaeon]
MIFLHAILGLILGKLTGHYLAFILGATLADIDHIYIYLKNGARSVRGIIDRICHEKRYHIVARTPLFHSMIGALLFTGIFAIFRPAEWWLFALAYCSHLLLDWPDKDPVFILYPWKYPFIGPLDVWSKPEQVITVLSLLFVLYIFIQPYF